MRNSTKNVYRTPKVWSYLRWSTNDQEWGDSERRQYDAAENWCRRQGLTLAGSEKDGGVSAYKGKNLAPNSNFTKLLKRLETGDFLLIEDNDRFTRKDPTTALTALRQIVDRGVRVVFLRTGVEVTAENFNEPAVLFPNFFQGYLANAESVKKAKRVKASWDARKSAAQNGEKPLNQNLPSWLRWDAQSHKVLIVPEKADIVRDIFERYVSGKSIRQISAAFNAENVPCITKTRRQKSDPNWAPTWNINNINRILRSRAVIGECLGVPHLWPQIVSDHKFYAAADRLDTAKHFSGPRAKSVTNLFQGLTLCHQCGKPMYKMTMRRKKGERSYLVCGAAIHCRSGCSTKGMRYDAFEQSFLGLNAATILKMLAGDPAPSPVDALRLKLQDVQAQCNGWLKSIEGKPEIPQRILEMLSKLETKEAGLQKQIEAEEAKLKATNPPTESLKAFRHELEQPAVKVDRNKCRELLRGFVAKIVVNPIEQTYTVNFKSAAEPMHVSLIAAG